MELEEYFKLLSEGVKTAKDNGEDIGACMVSNPLGGQTCIQVDEATCKDLKGFYLGGPCAAAKAAIKNLKKHHE